jgi:hypothetical protein
MLNGIPEGDVEIESKNRVELINLLLNKYACHSYKFPFKSSNALYDEEN